MIEYELSVSIKVENKEALDNLLITVESLQSGLVTPSAVELLSISGEAIENESGIIAVGNQHTVRNYEKDAWLSPLSVKQAGSV